MDLILQYVERDADGNDTTWTNRRSIANLPSQFTLGSAGDIVVDGDDHVMPQHVRVTISGNDFEIVPIAGITNLVSLETGMRVVRAPIQGSRRLRFEVAEHALRWWHLRIGNTVVHFVRPPPVVTTDGPTFSMPIGNPPAPVKIRPAPVRMTVWSLDPVEQTLLATLRDAPGDSATRAVYADWLEERDLKVHAEFVRGTVEEIKEPVAWRAVTSRAALPACAQPNCPRTWDALAPTPTDDLTRACAECFLRIHFNDFNPM